jgi:hypothetical protein
LFTSEESGRVDRRRLQRGQVPIRNLIVSTPGTLFAVRIAWRSDPAPLLLMLITSSCVSN